jgi:hypothetical protein
VKKSECLMQMNKNYALLSLRLSESNEKQSFLVAKPHYKLNKVLSDSQLMTCFMICLDECLNWIVACTLFGLSETLTLEWYNCKKFVITLEFDCLLRMMRILLRHSNLFMIMLYFFVYFEDCSWFANALLMPKKNVLTWLITNLLLRT